MFWVYIKEGPTEFRFNHEPYTLAQVLEFLEKTDYPRVRLERL